MFRCPLLLLPLLVNPQQHAAETLTARTCYCCL
jgi:hypothetical protein